MDRESIGDEPLHVRVQDVMARRGGPPWTERVLADGHNWAVLVCDRPGDSHDAHAHHDFNEWWIVLQGELVCEIGDYPPFHATKGDIVLSPAGTRHRTITAGDRPSLRLTVTKPGASHDMMGERGGRTEPFPDQRLPPNLLHARLDHLLAHFGEPPWSQALIADDRNLANLICHGPGMTNTPHWHPDFDEWWTVLKGELTWQIGGNRPTIHAREGDIVFSPRGMRHLISTVGTETSLRLAVGPPEAVHIYTDEDDSAPPPLA